MNRLLIVKLSSFGDVLHALPVVKSIKQEKPELFIGWVVRERCAGLLKGAEFVDSVHIISNKPSIAELLALRKKLHKEKYDTAFDMQGLLLSGVVTAMSGARRRVGLNRNREMNGFFLTEMSVDGKTPLIHAMDVQIGFRSAAGLAKVDHLPPLTHLGLLAADWVDSLRSELGSRQVVVLNVGASTIYKRWQNEKWSALANSLISAGLYVLLTAGPDETKDGLAIESGVLNKDYLTNLGGLTTSSQLAAVLERADVVVSGDTGPMHLAASMNTSTVALFGSTDPRLTGPYGDRHRVIWKQLACSPCFRHPTCNGRVDCMGEISVDVVSSAVLALLNESPRSATV